jgi:short-subunit dehydrogenase
MSATETVLITGASSGIGLELAKCFAADKSKLILVARNTAALEKLADELRHAHQIEVVVLTADLAKPESAREIFEQTGRAGITVDVLVNNAGFGLHDAFAKLPLPRQLEIIQVNVTALVALTGLFLPGMIQRKRGGVLNVGSVAGFMPGPHMAIYFATKAFVQSFTEALSVELSGSGVAISVLCPGPTESNFSKVARGERGREFKSAKMPTDVVAIAGHRAFRRNQCICVPGATNKILVAVPRIMPRSIVRKAVGKVNKLK